MSRYDGSDDCDDYWQLNMGRWERNSRAVLKSGRGKKALADLITALEALPQRRLISERVAVLTNPGAEDCHVSEVCAVGAYAHFKGIDLTTWVGEDGAVADETDTSLRETAWLGEQAGMAFTLAWNLGYLNDYTLKDCTPEERWQRVYEWATEHLSTKF